MDISTLERIIRILTERHCIVEYCIGDVGYCCPATMEQLVLFGIEFMAGLKRAYTLFKDALGTNFDEMMKPEYAVRYRDRIVQILKVPTVIGTDRDSGEEKTGFLYLCRDMQSCHSKSDHLMQSKKFTSMTSDEFRSTCDRQVFAVVTTRDLAHVDVLSEYYIRQGIEQYFGFGKNYTRFFPVRKHSMETLSGHLLLSSIATFFVITIRNRLNIFDTHYVGISARIADELEHGQEVIEVVDDHGTKYYIHQDPLLTVFDESPASLFFELGGQKADVFQSELISSMPVRQVVDCYNEFHLQSPSYVLREGLELKPVFRDSKKELIKMLAFSQKPTRSDDDIETKRKKKSTVPDASDKAESLPEEKAIRCRAD